VIIVGNSSEEEMEIGRGGRSSDEVRTSVNSVLMIGEDMVVEFVIGGRNFVGLWLEWCLVVLL
jgi:hypothetical protein